MTRRRLAILLGFLVYGALAFVTLGPFPQPDLPGLLGSVPHAVAYAAATWIVLVVIQGSRSEPVRSRTVAAVAVSMVALGLVLEVAQRVVGRDVEVADALADALGVAVAVAAWGLTHRTARSQTTRAE